MKPNLIPLLAIALATTATAREIRLRDCPPGVRQTIEARLEGGKLDDIDRIVRDGKERYIVEIEGPGRRDLTLRLTPAGDVLRETEDLTFKQCPAAVRQAIHSLLKKGHSIDDIDRETTAGGVRYRVEIDRRHRRDVEYTISPEGEILRRKVERDD